MPAPPCPPSAAAPRVAWLGNRPPAWPSPPDWVAPLGPDWPGLLDQLGHLQARGHWVLVFDAEPGLPDALARLVAVGQACRGTVPLIVLHDGGGPSEPEWWQAGAYECCNRSDTAHLAQALARAVAAVESPHGVYAQLRGLRLEKLALQASLDNIPAPIFVKDAQGIYIECNQAFQDYLGVSREQLLGKTVHQMWPAELAQVYDQADRRLLSQGGHQIYEAQVCWADGSQRDVMFHKAVWHDEDDQVAGQAGAIFDITQRKHLERQLRHLAETDPLTSLHNRRAFMALATQALARARDEGQDLALMLVDIDHFKQINDTWGHAGGDAALQHMATVLRSQMGETDVLARLGGDEFALVVAGTRDAQALAARLPKLVASLPLMLDGQPISLSISLGAALVQPDQHSPSSALHLADQALYQAKLRGRNQAQVIVARPCPGQGTPD